MVRRSVIPAFAVLALLLGACGRSDGSDVGPAASEASTAPVTARVDTGPGDTAVRDTGSGATDPGATDPGAADSGDTLYPDIVEVVASGTDGVWRFDVTVSSPYDSADRYADGFRVLGPTGAELGFRLLTHDHAAEQPFTRSLHGVVIPDGVTSVTVEGRDQVNGFGGATVEVTLPGR